MSAAQATARDGIAAPPARERAVPPPEADSGSVPNLRFAFDGAYRRVEDAGWSREVTERELPIARELAGVNMKLDPGGVRELHWHKQAEWAYMLAGSAQITALDIDAEPSVDEIGVGDLWYFPAGIPHSIQGLQEGCEFLLVFDDGGFSEDATFLLSDWLARTPREVTAAELGIPAAELQWLPAEELYIFTARLPESRCRPAATRFSHRLLEQEPWRSEHGSVRIVDSRNFPVSKTVAAALVEVQPGAMRELHWHPNTDEWQYYLDGEARMGVFAAERRARTFDYRGGDVGYVPFAMGHYIANVGERPLRFLEMFRSERFADVSLRRWLAGTPPRLVADHMNLGERLIAGISAEQRPIVPSPWS